MGRVPRGGSGSWRGGICGRAWICLILGDVSTFGNLCAKADSRHQQPPLHPPGAKHHSTTSLCTSWSQVQALLIYTQPSQLHALCYIMYKPQPAPPHVKRAPGTTRSRFSIMIPHYGLRSPRRPAACWEEISPLAKSIHNNTRFILGCHENKT